MQAHSSDTLLSQTFPPHGPATTIANLTARTEHITYSKHSTNRSCYENYCLLVWSLNCKCSRNDLPLYTTYRFLVKRQ